MTRLERFAWQSGHCLAYRRVFQGQRLPKIDWEIKSALSVFYIWMIQYVEGTLLYGVNIYGWCLSKNNQAFVMKKDRNRHNFSLKASIKKTLMLVLHLLVTGELKDLQIN